MSSSSAHRSSSDRQRHALLDLMRFGASMLVVLNHYLYSHDALGPLEPLRKLSAFGYLGVDFFFLISGLVILWSARGRPPSAFVTSRLLRLYPEFWISVLITAVVFRAFPALIGWTVDAKTVLVNLTMVPQYLGVEYVDGVYWTLGVELKFYALVWLALIVRQLDRFELWVYAWLALEALVFAFDLGGPLPMLVIHPYGPLLAAGCLFSIVSESGWDRKRVAAILVALALAVYQAIRSIPDFLRPEDIDLAHQVETALVLVAAFATIAYIVSKPATPPRRAAAYAALGRLTYPLYLLHNVGKILFIAALPMLPAYLAVPLAIGFSLALAYGVERLAALVLRPRLRALLGRLPFLATPAARPSGPA